MIQRQKTGVVSEPLLRFGAQGGISPRVILSHSGLHLLGSSAKDGTTLLLEHLDCEALN